MWGPRLGLERKLDGEVVGEGSAAAVEENIVHEEEEEKRQRWCRQRLRVVLLRDDVPLLGKFVRCRWWVVEENCCNQNTCLHFWHVASMDGLKRR